MDEVEQFNGLARRLVPAPEKTGAPNVQLTASPAGLNVGMDLSTSLHRLLDHVHLGERRHIAFLRDVFEVTSSVWRLGALYDRLYLGRRQLAEPSVHWPAAPKRATSGRVDIPLVTPSQLRAAIDERITETPGAAHVAIADIDHLDLFNEIGRNWGDEAIGRVAVALSSAGADLLTHVAGDSFIALLPGPPTSWTLRVKRALEGAGVTVKAKEKWVRVPLRVSIGSASAPGDGTTADALFGCALTQLRATKVKRRGETRDIEKALLSARAAATLDVTAAVASAETHRPKQAARTKQKPKGRRPSPASQARPLIRSSTDATFEQDVLQSTRPVVVDFWASWCGPCTKLLPELEVLATKYAGAVDFIRVDVDANPGLTKAFNITSIPLIALFRPNEQPIGVIGMRPAIQIEQKFGLGQFLTGTGEG